MRGATERRIAEARARVKRSMTSTMPTISTNRARKAKGGGCGRNQERRATNRLPRAVRSLSAGFVDFVDFVGSSRAAVRESIPGASAGRRKDNRTQVQQFAPPRSEGKRGATFRRFVLSSCCRQAALWGNPPPRRGRLLSGISGFRDFGFRPGLSARGEAALVRDFAKTRPTAANVAARNPGAKTR